jgi:hypothetical protein
MGRRRIMAVVVMSWVGTALDIAYAFGAPAGCILYTDPTCFLMSSRPPG